MRALVCGAVAIAFICSPAAARLQPALHFERVGSGTVTVVFLSGLGETLDTWDKVAPAISKRAVTIRYDRSGIGRSQDDGRSKSIASMVGELDRLLRSEAPHGPVILVGHSLGGAIAEAYAKRHADGVAGLVLVDPEDGHIEKSLEKSLPATLSQARQDAITKALPSMPAGVRAEQLAYMRSAADSVSERLPRVPIIVLTGTKKNPDFPGNPEEQDAKLALHNKLVAANPWSQHILVPNSRHYIQNDDPELVIAAIEREIASVERRH